MRIVFRFFVAVFACGAIAAVLPQTAQSGKRDFFSNSSHLAPRSDLSPVEKAIKQTQDARENATADYPQQLPATIRVLVEGILGLQIPETVAMPRWDQQREIFGQWLKYYGESLAKKSRNDVNRLLEYLMRLSSDEGYRDELDFIMSQINAQGGDVPAVFQEMPMENREYVILKVEATGYEPGDRVTEVTAVRYRGLQKIGQYHTLVNPQVTIPSWMVEKAGITQDMVQAAPTFGAVAQDLKDFLGDSPLVMHYADFHVNILNDEWDRLGKRPMLNEIIDTVDESHKVFPLLGDHKLGTIWRHLGFQARKELRGIAYARMYHWALQHIALGRKRQVETRYYQKFLKQFSVSSEITASRQFEELKERYGPNVEMVRFWKEIIEFVKRHGIKRIFMDIDITVFRSKGYFASDAHVSKRLAQDGPAAFVLNEYFMGDDYLTGELDFLELVDQEAPWVFKALKDLGVEIIGWTARTKRPGESEKLQRQFARVGMQLDDLLLCSGQKAQAMKEWYDQVEKGDNSQRVPTLVIDDSASNILKVFAVEYLKKNLYGLLARFEKEGYKDVYFGDFMQRANQSLKDVGEAYQQGDLAAAEGFMKFAMGSYFNAYRIALEKETPTKADEVKHDIQERTKPYATDPMVQRLWLRLEEKTLARQLSAMAIPEADRMRFGTLLPTYIDAISRWDPQIRVPSLMDATSWCQKTDAERNEELASRLPALRAGGFILPIGNFWETWKFSLALTQMDPSLAKKIHWPREYLQPAIPKVFGEVLAQKEWFGQALVPWERVEQVRYPRQPVSTTAPLVDAAA